MPSRDEYRKKAQDVVAQAELVSDPGERAALLTIAQFYLKLVDRIGARHDRGTAHRGRGEIRPENDS
jgi:hypothetical protein